MGTLLAAGEFASYGLSHWLVPLVFAAGAALCVLVGRKYREEPVARYVSVGLALASFVFCVASQLDALFPPSIERSVPLQLSDLAPLAATYAVWSHRHWVVALTYY